MTDRNVRRVATLCSDDFGVSFDVRRSQTRVPAWELSTEGLGCECLHVAVNKHSIVVYADLHRQIEGTAFMLIRPFYDGLRIYTANCLPTDETLRMVEGLWLPMDEVRKPHGKVYTATNFALQQICASESAFRKGEELELYAD